MDSLYYFISLLSIKTIFILNSIIDIDINLFLFLNGINSPTFDVIFFWITSKVLWIPLYLILFVLAYLKFKWRVVYVGLFIGLLLLVGDQVSVKLFKNVFERLRPCHNPDIANLVHLVDGCGGSFGFVSSHATNSFALAIFTGLLLKSRYKYLLTIMLVWAAVVSYSRIYVGVHYPADIISGAILGCIVGITVYRIMKFTDHKLNLKLSEL